MHRDSMCFQSILIFGTCIFIGISGCDRANHARNVQSDTIKVDRATTPQTAASAPDAETPQSSKRSPGKAKPVEALFRPADLRQPHDDQQLREVGIRVFESKHLKLYTDIEPEKAQELPTLVDQIYPRWESNLGAMLPDRAGTDFQMTGYLIRDLALFREWQLIPEELNLEHGRHRQNEFWLRDQSTDYYRRHLLLHEATHCYMTYLPNVVAPYWYLEGMAEYFASHEQLEEQPVSFCVVPSSLARFPGLGRIESIRDDVAKQQLATIDSIIGWKSTEFRTIQQYAWSWALCTFLDQNPKYRDRFRTLSHWTQSQGFESEFRSLFPAGDRDLATEWTLFATNLNYGYDLVRASIDFQSGASLTDQEPEHGLTVFADRGWQSSQVLLTPGDEYEITALGRFSLGQHPKPWISEADGITYRYFGGYPIGKLVGCIRVESGPAEVKNESMLDIIPLGQKNRLQASSNGTLYLRLNDAWNSLGDNQGQVTITIRKITKPNE